VLAKQVLSQLSYTPTKTTLILNHLPPFRIPIVRQIVRTVPNKLQSSCRCLCQILCQIAFSSHLLRSYFCKASLFFCEYFLNT